MCFVLQRFGIIQVEVEAIPARPCPILVPSVPSRIGPERAKRDFLATSEEKNHRVCTNIFEKFARTVAPLRATRVSRNPTEIVQKTYSYELFLGVDFSGGLSSSGIRQDIYQTCARTRVWRCFVPFSASTTGNKQKISRQVFFLFARVRLRESLKLEPSD